MRSDKRPRNDPPNIQGGFTFTPSGRRRKGSQLNGMGHRSVGNIEELTRMEKILDEWTPYTSISHTETGRWHTPRTGLQGCGGLRGHSGLGRRGKVFSLAGNSEIEPSNLKKVEATECKVQRRNYIGRRERETSIWDMCDNEGRGREIYDVTGSNRCTVPSHKMVASLDKLDGRKSRTVHSERKPWGYRQDKVPTIKKNHYGSVEDRIMRKQDEVQLTMVRNPIRHRTNWLTEATLKKLDDYHSDNLSENSYTIRKTTLNVPKENIPVENTHLAGREGKDTYKPQWPPLDMQKEREQGKEEEKRGKQGEKEEEEEDYGFVKRGILFWDSKQRRREEESENKVHNTKWRDKEADKCVREEEWIYKEHDTKWVAKADSNIWKKNQRQRKLEAERMFSENKKMIDIREQKYETRKDHKVPGNYWRIGYGDRGLNRELKVVRMSNEQLTSF